jgi:hypothetical protein
MSYIGNIPTTVAFLVDTFSGNGSTTAFTLSQAPANTSSILVAVSGVVQDPSTYSVSGVTLTFSGAPPSGTSNISVRFLGIPASGVATTAYRTVTEFTATAGQTTFSVPSYTAGYIDVYRNGVMLGSADYTATSGTTVVLAAGATAGDLVETISFFVSSVLNAIPAVAGAVNDTYLNTGAVTQSKLGANVVGNGPAFRVFLSGDVSITGGTNTKIAFNSESFDTNNNFDTSTNRFTPTVAGYYQINLFVGLTGATNTQAIIRKNGSSTVVGWYLVNTSSYGGMASDVIYMNGTTDYIEGFMYVSGNSTVAGGSTFTTMSGSLVRAA